MQSCYATFIIIPADSPIGVGDVGVLELLEGGQPPLLLLADDGSRCELGGLVGHSEYLYLSVHHS